ncbi:MAG: PAS domain S-box protein [Methanoregula sp.]|nr:PAS domain S-box protein [Methanoregula sp.]
MKKCSILVVDDEALIAANLVQTLSSLGYTVHKPVATGEEAIRAVKTQHPDLVLMDIKLIGEMDGIEAAEKIRAIADIPVVYLTAYTDDLRLAKARLTEPYGYIVKPAHSRELNATIEMAIYKHALDRKLKESEEKFRLIIENSHDIIYTLTADGVFSFVSPAWTTLLGHPVTQVTGQSFQKFVHPDDIPRCMAFLKSVIGTGQRQEGIEYRVQHTDGTWRWHTSSAVPIKDEAGTIVGGEGIARDITERKRTEEALREGEIKYRNLAETIQDFIITTDLDGIITYANPVARNLVGEGGLVGVALNDFLDQEQTTWHREMLDARRQGVSETLSFEWHIKSPKDGTLLIFDVRSSILIIDRGSPSGVLFNARDITERKRAEEALAESEERYRTILQTTMDGFWMIDVLDGKVTDVNETYCQMSGYTRAELLKMHIPDLDAKKTLDEQAATLQSIITNGSGIFETRHHRKDGSVFDVELSVTYQNTNGGELICFCRDITERKRAEEALRQANKQLNLLSGITRHDIVNQLFALKVYLELSHDVIDKPETLKEFIKKELLAANTIEEQITFTRDYQNLGVAAPAWQNVNARIKEAVDRLPMRAVRVEVDPANPEVYADPLFEKVFYNLLDNALRYGGDQMKTIRISSQESGTSLAILCENDGVGITAEDKKHLFSRGFGKNTGLGLFLSREILAITGITILETGKPGNGARFEITVPTGMWRTAGTGA